MILQYCCFYAVSVFPSSVCSQFYLPASQNGYYHSHTTSHAGQCPEFRSLNELCFEIQTAAKLLLLAVFAPATTANDPPRGKAKLAAAVPLDRSPQNHSKKSKRPEKSDLVSTGELLFAVVAIHFDFAEFGKILGKGSSFFCSRSAVIGIRPSAAAIGAEANAALGLKHNFSVLPIANGN